SPGIISFENDPTDPATNLDAQIPVGSLGIRTDKLAIYAKTGTNATDWTQLENAGRFRYDKTLNVSVTNFDDTFDFGTLGQNTLMFVTVPTSSGRLSGLKNSLAADGKIVTIVITNPFLSPVTFTVENDSTDSATATN